MSPVYGYLLAESQEAVKIVSVQLSWDTGTSDREAEKGTIISILNAMGSSLCPG